MKTPNLEDFEEPELPPSLLVTSEAWKRFVKAGLITFGDMKYVDPTDPEPEKPEPEKPEK